MTKLILSVLLLNGLILHAVEEKDEMLLNKPEEKGKKSLISGIKLDDYLRNLQGDEVLEKMDSNNKGNPDIFIVFKKVEGSTKLLVRHMFDLNRDRKIDLVKHFEKGKMVRTEADLDYDGVVDVVSDYDVVTGDLKKKTQADGATNIWKHYFKNELRKKELDRNSDGKPDVWVHYRKGKVIKTEVDKNFEGRIVQLDGPLSPDSGKKVATKKSDSASE